MNDVYLARCCEIGYFQKNFSKRKKYISFKSTLKCYLLSLSLQEPKKIISSMLQIRTAISFDDAINPTNHLNLLAT